MMKILMFVKKDLSLPVMIVLIVKNVTPSPLNVKELLDVLSTL